MNHSVVVFDGYGNPDSRTGEAVAVGVERASAISAVAHPERRPRRRWPRAPGLVGGQPCRAASLDRKVSLLAAVAPSSLVHVKATAGGANHRDPLAAKSAHRVAAVTQLLTSGPAI